MARGRSPRRSATAFAAISSWESVAFRRDATDSSRGNTATSTFCRSWNFHPRPLLVVATTRNPSPSGVIIEFGRSSIFSRLSKTISRSPEAECFRYSRQRLITILFLVGLSLVSNPNWRASSTSSLLTAVAEEALIHATRPHPSASHSRARNDANCDLPQPAIPTSTVRLQRSSITRLRNRSCSSRLTKRAATPGRLPNNTRPGRASTVVDGSDLANSKSNFPCVT